MKKLISLILTLVILATSFSINLVAYSATKSNAEKKLESIQLTDGFRNGERAAVTGNCYGFVSAVCKKLYNVGYVGEGLYDNFNAQHSSGNYYTVKTYTTTTTNPTSSTATAIKNFFVNNAKSGDVIHYGGYKGGSTHTFMVQHIDNEKMTFYHSNYETVDYSRESCHIDTIVWSSFVNNPKSNENYSNGSLKSFNSLFYNKMRNAGLGISINRFTNYNSLFNDAEASQVNSVQIPKKVTDLKVIDIKAEAIRIQWSKMKYATKYYVHITNKTKGTTFSKTVSNVDNSWLNYLTLGNTYEIKVKGANKDNKWGKYSDSITVKTKNPTVGVKNLTLTKRTSKTLSYSWNKVSGATKYYVEIVNLSSKKRYKKTVESNKTKISNLTPGVAYSVRVKAYKPNKGWGDYSKLVKTITRPQRITNVKLTSPVTTEIKTVWDLPKGKVSGYQMLYSRDKQFNNVVANKDFRTDVMTSYVGHNFTKGVTYYIKVRTYRIYNGKTYYGVWSDVKSVKSK